MLGVWEGEVQRYTSGVYVGVMGGGILVVCIGGSGRRVRYRGILVVCMWG